jgi:hypothetical protein
MEKSSSGVGETNIVNDSGPVQESGPCQRLLRSTTVQNALTFNH